ncbi:MAG: hypothetical protein ACREA9_16060 [Pyrinomonadaceae bacterium]
MTTTPVTSITDEQLAEIIDIGTAVGWAEYIEMARELIERRAGDGWVSVGERLPTWGYCIAYRPGAPSDNRISTLQYSPHAGGFSGNYIVTHWKPLPPSP